jgi:(S)-2-hydroxyglutarate dehydrogenase
VRNRYDVAIVGAGIVGLATARALMARQPALRVVVLDKEREVGVHQTGHNSGVLHSGVYYKPGSLKATLCISGKRALERYADERGIDYRRRGKLIVARDRGDLARLEELRRRSLANGVEGVREIEGPAIAEIEPQAVGIRALHVPATGVIDYGAVAGALADDLRGLGCEILLGREVDGLVPTARSLTIRASGEAVDAKHLIACAGLQADRLARLAGVRPPTRIVPFRGDYYTLRGSSAALVRALVYPVPDPAFPFLGVHFTRKLDGTVVAGPNAVLALARETYRRSGFRLGDAASALSFQGVWRFAGRHARTAAGEVWRDLSKQAFVSEMRRYVPAIRASEVTFGPTGIRAQAMTPAGGLIDDFLIAGAPRMMHVLNAPSPAATASLAIGEELADRALRDLLDGAAGRSRRPADE